MTVSTNIHNIFIDTNVFIGAYANIKTDEKALRFLYSLKGKRLFTSSLAIAQLASVFQKKKPNAQIKNIIKEICHRVNILSFSEKDIQEALKIERSDIEDNIQYVISSKMKCGIIVTNNTKDFKNFFITPIKPQAITSVG